MGLNKIQNLIIWYFVWERKQFHKDPAPPTMKKKEELANIGENIGENSVFVSLENFVKMQEIKIKRE